MSAQKYRKKPVEIEAWHWEGGPAAATPIIDWVLGNGATATWTEAHEGYEGPDGKGYPAEPECIRIDTLEGVMRASVGDYVIRGVMGEFYPCKPDIFEATYEVV